LFCNSRITARNILHIMKIVIEGMRLLAIFKLIHAFCNFEF